MSRLGRAYTPNEIVQGLKSKDQTTKKKIVKTAYDTLDQKLYDVALLVNAGIIPPLVQILSTPHNSDLLCTYNTAVECLIRICNNSHEHTLAVVNGGAIPLLVALINSKLNCPTVACIRIRGNVEYAAIELLGEMAAAGSDIRDEILDEGAIISMIPYMKNQLYDYKAFTAFRNICKKRNDQPMVKLELVLPALPTLAKQLNYPCYFAGSIPACACSAIYDLLEDRENIEVLQAVPELTKRVTKLMPSKNYGLNMLALKVISRMLKGTDVQRDRCLDAGCMEHLITFLKLKTSYSDYDFDLCEAKAGQGPAELEELCIKLELMNVLDHMDKLQRHEDEQVYLKNMHLIDTYFSMEDEHTQP